MQATSANEPGLIHDERVAQSPRPVERRHTLEYLESRGFDYPLALFWGAYLAFCTSALIAVVGS